MAHVPENDLEALEAILLNMSGDVPLRSRFRALFTLKSLKNERAVQIISKGFGDPSALLKHELAYCLGQMENPCALPILKSVLADLSEDPMVRHEAAEAIGAISDVDSLPVLQKYLSDPERTVRETCQIAIAKIDWDGSQEGQKYRMDRRSQDAPRYTSVDPAPATSNLLAGPPKSGYISESAIVALRAILLDKRIPLFERYRSMFALRNIGTPAAVEALADGFSDDSALFKHEIAFVFGQLLSEHSVAPLLRVLENENESDMVRHEAAEALGGIGTPEVLPYLKLWMTRESAPRVVRESCQVAVDMWEYGNSDQFQLADGLESSGTPQAVGV